VRKSKKSRGQVPWFFARDACCDPDCSYNSLSEAHYSAWTTPHYCHRVIPNGELRSLARIHSPAAVPIALAIGRTQHVEADGHTTRKKKPADADLSLRSGLMPHIWRHDWFTFWLSQNAHSAGSLWLSRLLCNRSNSMLNQPGAPHRVNRPR